ncbi:MAG: protein kinase [Deltaproteobacteria bacterium]|nr:protein kinase [Deltaproteobacteria bacterium]
MRPEAGAPPSHAQPAPHAQPAAPPVAPARADDHALPQTFFVGRYRVVDEIGNGGMASVHLARVDGPGGFQKWVAIKRIHPHLVEDDQFVDMFLDEARIAAGINHANVAQVFDLGKDDNTYWIAMEYLHGEPLREVMRRVEDHGATVPFHIAARICADAAEGLHGAHELRGRNGQLLNLVHRDVTPHNLFVTYDGYTKVVDFGIAKVVDRLASTRAGTLKGKLAYMSPEQVRGQEIDRRTDIFALGVVLWELTTNRRLFRMETDLDTLEKVQACVVPLPSTIVPGYPAELEQVVMRALAQRREDRFQTAREFSRALQASLMRQGLFVAPEDVGDYLKQMFADRLNKRERYLEWAAEFTGAVDIGQLQAQADASVSLLAAPQPGRSAPQPQDAASRGYVSGGSDQAAAFAVVTSAPRAPLAPAMDLAATSLMDEDEDIPTQVATEALMPRPDSPHQAQSWGAKPGGEVDFESTIAMVDPGSAGLAPPPPQRAAGRSPQTASMPQAPLNPAPFNPAPLNQAPPNQAAQLFASVAPPAPQGLQGAIETKMSLPRPAALADFLVEQGDIAIPLPRTTGVLVAIALLATLCVIGIGALVIYKLQHRPQSPTAVAALTAGQVAGSLPIGDGVIGDGVAKANHPTATGGGRDESGRRAESEKGTAASDSRVTGAAPGTSPSASAGRLTVECTPACDSVVAAGRSLGPSPVVAASLPPGSQRVTVKRGAQEKTIVVNVESGLLTSQTVAMN